MPSHKLHEEVGCMLGLKREAVWEANMRIDFPENFPELRYLDIKHDDDRLFAMEIIRGILRSLYGRDGVLAADIHYALDYIDTWLDPGKAGTMLKTMKNQFLLPRNRYGFVDPVRRLWSPIFSHGMLPITAYCMKCRGINKPTGSPFCNECRVNMLEVLEVRDLPREVLLLMLNEKMNERKIDSYIKDFVVANLSLLINKVIEDREGRGYASLLIV
jgi:hypothetical protein